MFNSLLVRHRCRECSVCVYVKNGDNVTEQLVQSQGATETMDTQWINRYDICIVTNITSLYPNRWIEWKRNANWTQQHSKLIEKDFSFFGFRFRFLFNPIQTGDTNNLWPENAAAVYLCVSFICYSLIRYTRTKKVNSAILMWILSFWTEDACISDFVITTCTFT